MLKQVQNKSSQIKKNKNSLFFLATPGQKKSRGPSQTGKQINNNLILGESYIFKVTAMGPNNIGIDEFSFGYSILIPSAKIGSIVKAQIIKINLNKAKYAIAKVISIIQDEGVEKTDKSHLEKLQVGLVFDVKVNQLIPQTSAGFSLALINLTQLSNGEIKSNSSSVFGSPENAEQGANDFLFSSYSIIVPVSQKTIIGQHIQIQITKIKTKYSFAKVLSPNYKINLKNEFLNEKPSLSLHINKNLTGSFSSWSSSSISFADKSIRENTKAMFANSTFKDTNSKNLLSNWSEKNPGIENILKNNNQVGLFPSKQNFIIRKGAKISLILPKKLKQYGQHIVINIEGTCLQQKLGTPANDQSHSMLLFIKNTLGATVGEKVRIRLISSALPLNKLISKTDKLTITQNKGQKDSSVAKASPVFFLLAEVIRIMPPLLSTKIIRVQKNLTEMLQNGLHFGEKIVKCQAKMKTFIWTPNNLSKSSAIKKSLGLNLLNENSKNKSVSSSGTLLKKFNKSLLLHEGTMNFSYNEKLLHSTMRKDGFLLNQPNAFFNNPSVNQKPLKSTNFRTSQKSHLINLFKTRRCSNIALTQLGKYAIKGRTFLFVGTKKPAAGLISRAALFSKNSFFVNTRWLGGMLTNWKTIVKSISKIRPILKEKEKVITTILKKRLQIQNRLIQKIFSLRKKSKILTRKGKELITVLRKSSNLINTPENTRIKAILFTNNKLRERHKYGSSLLEQRSNLLKKESTIKEKSLTIKKKSFIIFQNYKTCLNQIALAQNRLINLKRLYLLNKEIRQIKNLAKKQQKSQCILSYVTLKNLLSYQKSSSSSDLVNNSLSISSSVPLIKKKRLWLIPNPPQEILKNLLISLNEIPNPNYNSSFGSAAISTGEKKLAASINTNSIKNSSLSLNSSNFIILTKLLSQFSKFLSYLKQSLKNFIGSFLNFQAKIQKIKGDLKKLKVYLKNYLGLKTQIINELLIIKTKYLNEQKIIRLLKQNLKRHEAEKNLLQFLPKLRYLPTPKNQISLAIQLLMKRFVDPKLKYPLDSIYNAKLRNKSKKMAAARKKKWQRLETYFGGISSMTKLQNPEIAKNVAIIIGQKEEINAVMECKKLGIKMFHIIDTNCNPNLADHYIPSNDDSRNAIKYVLAKMLTRIRLAHKIKSGFLLLNKA